MSAAPSRDHGRGVPWGERPALFSCPRPTRDHVPPRRAPRPHWRRRIAECSFARGAEGRADGLSSPLGLRCEVPATAMRTRVRAPLAAASPPPQVAVEPNTPQRPLGAGGGAVADLVLAVLHRPPRPIGTAQRGRETRACASRRTPRSASSTGSAAIRTPTWEQRGECFYARIAGARAAPRDTPACRPLRASGPGAARHSLTRAKRNWPRADGRTTLGRTADPAG